MSLINDPDLVRKQYASEDNLRARQALYEETTGPDPREALWQAIIDVEPSRVLEVGGGPGELAERMRTELGCRVSYIDISPRMVELARARGVDAQLGDVQELPFGDGSFDTAVAAWMLYHVPDLDRGLAELARVLEPGGRLVANTNSVDHLRELRDLVAYPAGVYEHMFNSENGEEILRRHFIHVHRIDATGSVTVRDRRKLVAYQRSTSVPTSPVPDDVPLPFVMRRAGTVFVATK
jgi:SAM-dependent methyltransferase